MTDDTMKALTDEVARTWGEFQEAVAAVQRYAKGKHVASTREAKADPAKLALITDLVEKHLQMFRANQWNTQGLATALRLSWPTGLTVKTLQNVYLPALRATSPHCIRSGRQFLWYLHAGRSKEST